MQIRRDRLKGLLADGPSDRLLDVDTAADRLSIEPATLRRWIEQSRVPAVYLGRSIRVRQSDIEDVVAHGLPDKDNVAPLHEAAEDATDGGTR